MDPSKGPNRKRTVVPESILWLGRWERAALKRSSSPIAGTTRSTRWSATTPTSASGSKGSVLNSQGSRLSQFGRLVFGEWCRRRVYEALECVYDRACSGEPAGRPARVVFELSKVHIGLETYRSVAIGGRSRGPANTRSRRRPKPTARFRASFFFSFVRTNLCLGSLRVSRCFTQVGAGRTPDCWLCWSPRAGGTAASSRCGARGGSQRQVSIEEFIRLAFESGWRLVSGLSRFYDGARVLGGLARLVDE